LHIGGGLRHQRAEKQQQEQRVDKPFHKTYGKVIETTKVRINVIYAKKNRTKTT
jgi:hypothetical protein